MTNQQDTHRRTSKPIHFGAVYFRKSAPPARDWERDYARALEDGHTMFRHWFVWGAIEQAPGVFDWDDYDRHLELAAKYGIRTVIAEMLIDSPEWLYYQSPHARLETVDGKQRQSEMHISCATGGHASMCLDNPEVAEAGGEFLRQLARRYKDHPGLYGYDVWNECTFYNPMRLCYCPATQRRFRAWLQRKYGDLRALSRAWLRFSFTDWDQVHLPRTIGPYPEVYDAIRFFNDNAFAWMKWRVDVLKSVDTAHPVVAHGNAKSFVDIAPACGDDWRAGELVDQFGYTYWYGNQCHPFLAGDLIRSASRGKEFWRAEAVGNSDWQGRPASQPHIKVKDQMAEPTNIRLDSMISFATGSRGYINPRWRPLLHGPLAGAFGWYGLDGSPTERSMMAAETAQWANAATTLPLWEAQPVRGEVGLLLLEEAQAHCYAWHGDTHIYSYCYQGAYEAFLASNIQCDPIKLDQIDNYKLVYVPYPLGLSQTVMDTLRAWIARGGCLVSEACFGYFDAMGEMQVTQPNRGFAEVFGGVEGYVSLAPDRWNSLSLHMEWGSLAGAVYRQAYLPAAGTPRGWFDDGSVAALEHQYGTGRALLVGTMPSYAYKSRPDELTRQWFGSLIAWAGMTPIAQLDRPSSVVARLWHSPEAHYLWIVNQGSDPITTTVTIGSAVVRFETADAVRGAEAERCVENSVTLQVGGRDASVLRLR